MSRDLTKEERDKFVDLYGTGEACKNCQTKDVTVKIWEKYGTDAFEVGGDIGPSGIIGAIVACDACGHSETVAREHIQKAS
ncbi:MAG: hypothetical protein OEM91_17425 [Hyphomicrobiales bacterium]|nr:hypothetical protein [Hyphomicrobiales bacterium]